MDSDLIAPGNVDGQRIVPKHLDQVVGKRIIIVDDKQSGHPYLPAEAVPDRRDVVRPKKKSHPLSLGGLACCITHHV